MTRIREIRAAAALAAVLITALTIAPARADDLKKVEKEMRELYAQQAASLEKRDVAGFMKLNTPDFQLRLLTGDKVDRERLEEGMTTYFTSGQLVKQISVRYDVTSVKREGNEAQVMVEQMDKRVQIRKDGKPHTVEAHVVHRDTWVPTADGWKRRLTEEVKQKKFLVDGKPSH